MISKSHRFKLVLQRVTDTGRLVWKDARLFCFSHVTVRKQTFVHPPPALVDQMEMCWAELSSLALLCAAAAALSTMLIMDPDASGDRTPVRTRVTPSQRRHPLSRVTASSHRCFPAICCEAADVALMLTHGKFYIRHNLFWIKNSCRAERWGSFNDYKTILTI